MRHAIGTIPFLLAMAALPAAGQLPASCGGVGAKSYTPSALTIPPVVLNRGTVITVTNATMVVNGDTSSVKALVANPGSDGISLLEAITATNNDPGTWVIQFAPALKGSTISVDSAPGGILAGLSGGNVTINGDIDGDGQPDITLTTSQSGVGIAIGSGGNTLYGLALQNFTYGVWISAPPPGQPGATGGTLSNITISNLVLTDIQYLGIGVNPPGSPANQSTLDHILITGNTISGNAAGPVTGIDLEVANTGNTLQHITVANNNMTIPMSGGGGIAMNVGAGMGSTNNQALDILIANNTISAVPFFGIRIGEGLDSASGNLIDGVQIIANQIHVSSQGTGINLAGGDGASDDRDPSLLPIQHSQNNVARNIGILSNTIEGAVGGGIFVLAACCGNFNNTIGDLSILGNTVTGVTNWGVLLASGGNGSFDEGPTTGNELSNLLIQANSIQMTPLIYPGCNCYPGGTGLSFGGIQVWAGWQEPGDRVSDISIANNEVDTPLVSIGLIAGWGGGGGTNLPPFSADNNVVAHPQIYCNQVDQAPTAGLDYPGIKGISVTAGLLEATGNQVLALRMENNLVGGVLNDTALFANLGTGASGNTISVSKISAPGSCDPRISPMRGTTCRLTPPGGGR